ncbi:MAG TPA: SDR family oxidoreductase [Caulobacterales bacterium]|nr:SDR family oxidoreductase [Caulobacterales bacterium]
MLQELFSLEGKTALVTGGANGMGRMIAEGLSAAGARVVLTSRKLDDAESAARELGKGAVGVAADLTKAEGCASLVERVRAECDTLEILVNNAGRTWGNTLETFPDRGWDSVWPINVQTPFRLVRDLLPQLKAGARADDPARVINIGSVSGKAVEPLRAYSYVASKAAIHHLSRALAADLAEFNITVNAVVPGYFPTHMTDHMRDDETAMADFRARVPLRRMGTAPDIAGACIFLASRAGAYVTGAELVLDGGMSGCR